MEEKWKSLIEEYKDDLRIQVEWAIDEAFNTNEGIVDVILDENGKAYIVNSPSLDTIASEVSSGNAIYIGRFDAKDYDFKNIIHNLKEEEFKDLFEGYKNQKYLKEYGKSYKKFEDPNFFDTLPEEIKNYAYWTIFNRVTYEFYKENNLEYNWDLEAELEDGGYISDTPVIHDINEDLQDLEDLTFEDLINDEEDF
jgi:hypothetical protein